ncbi:MAG: preprotein translocase subunit SecE [Polyangiaceae bacterium]|nr:preprotein translocase subunit SecE [Polyangiaceae bacterium]
MASKEKEREAEDVEETEGGDASDEELDQDLDDSGDDSDDSDDDDSDDDDSDDDDSDYEGDDEAEASGDDDVVDAEFEAAGEEETEEEDDGESPANLGTTRYVHAALFSAGILLAYIAGKLLGGLWNVLAEWPAAVDAVPQLLAYSEDDRPTFTMAAGAVIGAITIIQIYRKPHIRAWADEVAQELTKVTWPNRETVANGTIVVVVASIIATVYIAVLDRFWGFVTSLVYGV